MHVSVNERRLADLAMLLPGYVRTGLATCNGSLLVYTAPSPYNVQSKTQNYSSSRFDRSGLYHDFHRPLLCGPRVVSLQYRHLRASSSHSRAKAALKKRKTPYHPASKIALGSRLATDEENHSKPVLQTLGTLTEEIVRLQKLKGEYYKSVDKHNDVLWFTYEECKEVSGSAVNGWIRRPASSRNPRCNGISRQCASVGLLLSYISNPETRKRVISWEQTTCSDLAPQFKDMVIARARFAKLAGFKSYFDFRSRYNMLNPRSVKHFLKNIQSQVQADAEHFVESILEQKMRDLNYGSIQELRQKLKKGKTVRDFQLYCPDAQVNWGDVFCKTAFLKSDHTESSLLIFQNNWH